MLKQIKNHFMFNEVMLPNYREMTDVAERFILNLNPQAAKDDNLHDRAAVVAGVAWEELCAQADDIDELFGAPLPYKERFLDQLKDDNAEVREFAQEVVDLHKELEEETQRSLPFRFFLQHSICMFIISNPGESIRFATVFSYFYPDDLGIDHSYEVSEDGMIVSAQDQDGNPVSRGFMGQVYGDYLYPLQSLGFRYLQSATIEEEASEDLDSLASLNNLDDLFGEGL